MLSARKSYHTSKKMPETLTPKAASDEISKKPTRTKIDKYEGSDLLNIPNRFVLQQKKAIVLVIY